MSGRKPSHCQLLLELLGDGEPHTTSEILRLRPMIVHSRVADLRARGYTVECVRVEGCEAGSDAYSYRLLAEPTVVPPASRAAALARPVSKDCPPAVGTVSAGGGEPGPPGSSETAETAASIGAGAAVSADPTVQLPLFGRGWRDAA